MLSMKKRRSIIDGDKSGELTLKVNKNVLEVDAIACKRIVLRRSNRTERWAYNSLRVYTFAWWKEWERENRSMHRFSGSSQRNFRRVSAWKSWNHRRFNNSLALSLNSKQISFTFQRDINLEKSLSPSHSLCIHVCKNKNNFVVIAAKVERKSQQRLSKINFESWKFFLTLDRLRILTKLPPDEHTRRCEENKRKTSNHENKKKIRFHALTKSRN